MVSVLAVFSTTDGFSETVAADASANEACAPAFVDASILVEFSGPLGDAGDSIVGCGSGFLRNNNISIPASGFALWSDKCPALNHTARPYEVVKGTGDRSGPRGFFARRRRNN
jgi:hypothetical protein